MARLSNKVAIVTGASSGIGRATARLFASEGASVVATARRGIELDTLMNEIHQVGGMAVAMVGDVCDEKHQQAIVEKALSEFGGLDIAVNNAGSLGNSISSHEKTLAAWNQELMVNLTSGFLGAKYQVPAMLARGGSIVFNASFVGYTVGMPQMAAYAAAKAGLVGLTKALAVEYGSSGVRVNAILPGGTKTPMADEFGTEPEVVEFVNNMHALKRQASAEEIACSMLYLASDDSRFTTGSAMLVDGGVSINKT